MPKSKWRQEQEQAMDRYDVRMTAAHARRARKIGKGNLSDGVRQAIEAVDPELGIPDERRIGQLDRRKK